MRVLRNEKIVVGKIVYTVVVYSVGHFLTSQTRQLTATVIYMQVLLQKKYASDQKKSSYRK